MNFLIGLLKDKDNLLKEREEVLEEQSLEIERLTDEGAKMKRRIQHMERLISTQAIREGTVVQVHKAKE